MKKSHLRKASSEIILRKAIEDNDIAQVRFVLRFESDKVNDQDENDMTALHWSCVHGRLEIIGLLLEYGANMEIRDSKGWTALHFAADGGFLDVVELLLASYADVTATSNDGKSVIDVARGEGMVFLLATGFIKSGKEDLLLKYFNDSSASLHSIDEADEDSLVSSTQSELSREIWRASQHLLTKSSSLSINSKSSLRESTSEYVIAEKVETITEKEKLLLRKNSTPTMHTGQSYTSMKKKHLNNFDSSFSPGVLKRLAVSETNLDKTQEMDSNNNDDDEATPCGTINRTSNYYALNTVESDTNLA